MTTNTKLAKLHGALDRDEWKTGKPTGIHLTHEQLDAYTQAIKATQVAALKKAQIEHLNFVLDLRRVLGWERPLNNFPEIQELELILEAYAAPAVQTVPKVQSESILRWLAANCKPVGWNIDTAIYQITDRQALELVAYAAPQPPAKQAVQAVPKDRFLEYVTVNQSFKLVGSGEFQFWEKVPAKQAVPVAWRRKESGDWVYYSTKVWGDLEPLYATPQAPTAFGKQK